MTATQTTRFVETDPETERFCQCSVCSTETERLCPCGGHRYLKLDAEGHPVLTTEHEDWCPADSFSLVLVSSEPEDKVPG